MMTKLVYSPVRGGCVGKGFNDEPSADCCQGAHPRTRRLSTPSALAMQSLSHSVIKQSERLSRQEVSIASMSKQTEQQSLQIRDLEQDHAMAQQRIDELIEAVRLLHLTEGHEIARHCSLQAEYDLLSARTAELDSAVADLREKLKQPPDVRHVRALCLRLLEESLQRL